VGPRVLTDFSGDGGPGTEARLSIPQAVQVDAAGNVLIADALNNRMRAVAAATGTFYGVPMRTGRICTGQAVKADLCGPSQITGKGADGYVGWPSGVTVTPAGDVVLGDCLRLRRIAG
jgi:hypothetical protein